MTQTLKKIPLKIWFFAFTVLLLIGTVINLPSVGAEDQTRALENAAKYDHDAESLRGAVVSYHKNMNEIMNDFTEKLLGETDPDKRKEISGPPTCDSDTGCATAEEAEAYCDAHPENVSTYCLAVKMTYEYLGFREAMIGQSVNSHTKFTQDDIDKKDTTIQEKFDSCIDTCESKRMDKYQEQCEETQLEWADTDCSVEDNPDSCEETRSAWNAIDCVTKAEDQCNYDCEYSVNTPILDLQIDRLGERQDLINEQVGLAKDVLDLALATYDQLLMYYELHVGYQQILSDLETYRDELAGVRSEVEEYPGKFHNVTTTECT